MERAVSEARAVKHHIPFNIWFAFVFVSDFLVFVFVNGVHLAV